MAEDLSCTTCGEAHPTEPVGETETLLASLDLTRFQQRVDNRSFRMRRIDLEPGGIVPYHSHEDRPAIMYIAEGTVVEHNSAHREPRTHHQGEVVTEFLNVAHWWKNETDRPVVIIAADLADPAAH